MTRDHRHDHLDDAIDFAARTMTDATPAAGLRARVIARLPATPRRSWMRIAAPVAAAATLGVFWLVAGRGSTGTTGTTGSRKELTQSSSFGRAEEVAKLEPSRHHGPVVPVVPVDDAWTARAIPALPAVTHLTMAPIQPAPLSIAPITMEPIVIGPVNPGDGGRR